MPPRLLQLFEPETAHAVGLSLLPLLPRRPPEVSPALAVDVAGMQLAHPIALAAGLDKNAKAARALFGLGFSMIEVGTVTPRRQAGNPQPRLFRLQEDAALINRLGFNNDGLDTVAARLEHAPPLPGPIGINLGINRDSTAPVEDYLIGLERVARLVDYVTINISSPNTRGLRALQEAEAMARLSAAIVARNRELPQRADRMRPIFIKLAPDLTLDQEKAAAEVALSCGLDGLVVSNTTVDRPATLASPARGETGGLSGPPLFARSTAMLARLSAIIDGRIALIGAGGVRDGATVFAKIRAGASAVQLYTSIVYHGPMLVRRVLRELEELMEVTKTERLSDAIGCDRDRLRFLDGRRRAA